MDSNIRRQAEELLAQMLRMFREGEIPAESYYKCIVCVASEYLVGNEIEEGISLLTKCPQSYFDSTMERQMDEDDEFAYIGNKIFKILKDAGLLDPFDSDIRPTQAMGLA